MRTDTTVSDKQALIGFPRGSKDMEMLLTDLDDDQLKNFLNEGRSLTGSAWDNFALFNQSMFTLLSEIHAIPSKIPIREPNLRSLADAMSTFDSVNIPPLNFDLMIKSLNLLESIYDERSLEVASFKKSVLELQDLQFADLRRKHSLSKLLTLADLFFKSLFLEQKKSETNGLVAVWIIIFAVIIISVFALFVFWVWSIKAKKGGRL
uniref:Uncharacterized protein n=1 Tax=Caenorhabditis japonica TaxID=281687 RepID=A0A8R1EW77_CAEJA